MSIIDRYYPGNHKTEDFLTTYVFCFLKEKKPYDGDSFLAFVRDGLENSGPDLDAILKFLENGFDSNKFGFSSEKREQLFEILVIGKPLGKVIKQSSFWGFEYYGISI